MAKPGRHPKGAKTRTPVQTAFLQAYANLGTITAAARAAGCDPSRHRNDWVKDPKYLADFQEAHHQACDLFETEMIRRATRGTDRPVFHQGKQCGAIREYSDSLLLAIMRAKKPEYAKSAGSSGADVAADAGFGTSMPRE